MTEMLELHRVAFETPPAPAANVGPVSSLVWIPIDKLRIDPLYQRPVARRGEQNIRRIVERFSWSLFSPLVVCCRPGGLFAIVDGQHRAIAAKVHGGIPQLPCMIIAGTPEDEARAFAVINGQVTSVLPTQIFYARIASKEPEALAVKEACDAAGVRVLKTSHGGFKVGQTLAISAIETAYRNVGRDTFITAMMCIVDTGDGNAGYLRAPVIRAMSGALKENPVWRDAGEALFVAIEGAGIRAMYQAAMLKRAKQGGQIHAHMHTRICAVLEKTLGSGKEKSDESESDDGRQRQICRGDAA